MSSKHVKREPVDHDYTALNWDFIKAMAWIPLHAAEKYGSWHQYTAARLSGEKSPANHAIEHIARYLKGEPYDKLDGHPRRHLVAAAYNLMMAYYYDKKFGPEKHPLVVDEEP